MTPAEKIFLENSAVLKSLVVVTVSAHDPVRIRRGELVAYLVLIRRLNMASMLTIEETLKIDI